MALYWRRRLFYVALVMLLAGTVFQLRIETDLSAFMLAGQSEDEVVLANEMQSGALSRRYILSLGRNQTAQANFQEFVTKFKQLLLTNEAIVSVRRADRQKEIFESLASYYSLHSQQLYSLNPEYDSKQLFMEEALDRRAKLLKNSILSPQGRLVKKVVSHDPLLLTFDGFRHQAQRLLDRPLDSSRFVMLIVETRHSGVNAPKQKIVQNMIRQAFSQTETSTSKTVSLEMTGVPIFAVETQRILTGDIQRISLVSSLLLIVLFLWIFKSPYALLWVSLVLVAAVSTAVFVTNLIFGYVHGLTLAVGTSLIGVCIDYPIHALVHTSTVPEDKRQETIRTIWPSLLLGGVTTLIGYSALGFSGYPGFQQIAVYATCGIGMALILTRYVLSGLTEGKTYRWNPNAMVTKWLVWSGENRRFLLTLIATASLIVPLAFNQLRWVADLEELTPELNSLKEQDRIIRSRMISVEPGRFVLVRSKNLQSALLKSELVYRELDRLRNNGELEDYFGLYPWLVSHDLQRRNQAALAAQFTEAHTTLWKQALSKNGLSVKRLASLTPQEAPPILLGHVKQTPAWRLLENQIVFDEQNVLLIIWLSSHSPAALSSALSKFSGVKYFSQREIINRLTQDYQQRAVNMLSAGLAIIFTLLMWRYRKVGTALLALLPALVSATVILSAWSLSGESLSFLHLVGFLLAIAICVDYGIFFLENPSGDHKITYHAIMASMLTSAVAFSCLGLAESNMLKILSATVASGVIVGFLVCPIFIRPGLKPVARHD